MRERALIWRSYNILGRDCGGLSTGGALTTADYKAWIDGFAAGIGSRKAMVILEPDALGLIPSSCNNGAGEPGFTDAARFEEINYAVDALEAQPNSIGYLDATHSAWLNVHDAASRLLQGGVQRAQGFFLNVSNFQYTPNLVQYGTWISKCIARITGTLPSDDCPDQYWNGGPHRLTSPTCSANGPASHSAATASGEPQRARSVELPKRVCE